MNNSGLDLSFVINFVKVVIREAINHKSLVALTFAVISLTVLLMGTQFPKKFSAETKIFADSQNIIRPLLQGQAATTSVSDHVRTVREVITSPRLMREVIEKLSLVDNPKDPVALENTIRSIAGRLQVSGIGPGLIRIGFSGSDPSEVYNVVSTVTDLFIKNSSESKRRESREAFLFIDKQAKNYKDQLVEAEERLKQFNASNYDGTEAQARARIQELENQIEALEVQIEESNTRIDTLERELVSESRFVENRYRADELRTRLVEAQNRLDTLRLTYTDDYPDVVALKQQIRDLKFAIRNSEAPPVSGPTGSSGSEANVNPLYEELRKMIATEKVDVNAARRRLQRTEQQLEEERKRMERIAERQAELAELTRDYDVTRSIYEDMLERKERARLSMTLDIEGQGVTFRVQEPANFPIQPDGLRFLHFVMAGPLLGVLFPLGLLVVYVYFDPRIRFASSLESISSVPILGVVPHMSTPLTKRIMRTDVILLGLFVIVVMAVYLAIAFAHRAGVF
ncbi:MAG: XrtA system polysaccharide chain length determinant [Pseudomonadota bacterium]|nr:chain length-determining protein [Pseudomonadales bacterium]MDY6918971.1 XrtA system polysaccharide chain length determinant [Pseudomonadota bacterium]